MKIVLIILVAAIFASSWFCLEHFLKKAHKRYEKQKEVDSNN